VTKVVTATPSKRGIKTKNLSRAEFYYINPSKRGIKTHMLLKRLINTKISSLKRN
jgi:hypothetical protein